MRIATWNLLHATPIIGAPAEPDLSEQAKLIRADIIGVQEVDRNQPRSNHQHQLQDIATALDLPHWIYVPTVIGTPGETWEPATDHSIHLPAQHSTDAPEGATSTAHYGNGLASKYPLSDVEILRFNAAPISLPLAVPGEKGWQMLKVADEPRVAILATVDSPVGKITVATTHLSFVPGVNAKQLRAITRAMQSRNQPAILLGDFNLIGKLPARLTKWKQLAQLPTYPVVGPRIQFDHILGHGISASAIHFARSRAQRLALAVSDHCALVTDLDQI